MAGKLTDREVIQSVIKDLEPEVQDQVFMYLQGFGIRGSSIANDMGVRGYKAAARSIALSEQKGRVASSRARLIDDWHEFVEHSLEKVEEVAVAKQAKKDARNAKRRNRKVEVVKPGKVIEEFRTMLIAPKQAPDEATLIEAEMESVLA